jgi:hypothetical protein
LSVRAGILTSTATREFAMLVSSLCVVGYDDPALGLDIWPAEPAYCKRDVAQASFSHSRVMAQKADALGFDWASSASIKASPYCLI